MRRREFIAGLTGLTATLPLASRAQQGNRMRRLGVLMSFAENDPGIAAEMAVLRQGLAERGWIEGQTIEIIVRWAGGNNEFIEAMAKEMVGASPDVLLTRTTPATAALQKETRTIPIVIVNVTEPAEQGFVQSLARPGGNITGFSNFEALVGSKLLELLREIDPGITRVLVIYNPQTAPFAGSYLRPLEAAAARLAIEATVVQVQSPSEIEAAMRTFARQQHGGLVVIPDVFTIVHRDLVIGIAGQVHLPAIYGSPFFVEGGGLMAYAVDPVDQMRRAAGYVDRILRGEKPADLPIQQPVKFQLVINKTTAKALGLEISPTLGVLADEVIE
jgi:putative tryptophan/tyrosine transport system substrate-binding protein